MKRLSYIVIFIVAFAGTLQWLFLGFSVTWEPRLRSFLERSASRLTQKNVQVETITLAYLKGFRLINVRVRDPLNQDRSLFEASQIELSLSPLGLPRALYRRNPVYAIGGVHLTQPRVKLARSDLPNLRASPRATSLLPWFKLSWEDGTFQWEDPDVPAGPWSLFQAKGSYRIRGPQTSLFVTGRIREADRIDFEGSTLGRRWSAHVEVFGCQTQAALDLARTHLRRPFLPTGWTVPGHFDFEVEAGGRSLPRSAKDWIRQIKNATLRLSSGPESPAVSTPALALEGTWTYRKQKVSSPRFLISCPWFKGQGRAELTPELTESPLGLQIRATLESGTLGAWPFQNASVQMSYRDGVWESQESTFQFLNGRVTTKGHLRGSGTDLTLTAENLSLAALNQEGKPRILEGQLNASCALKGPWDNYQLTGAWWLSGGAWGPTALGEAKGDLEMTRTEFQALGKSETTHFRVALAGHQTSETIHLDHLDITLPSGASLSAEGRYEPRPQSLRFTWSIAQADIVTDLPFLSLTSIPLRGHASAQGHITGTAQDPQVKATLESRDLTFYEKPLGLSSGNLIYDKGRLALPSIQIGQGIRGQYAENKGTASFQDVVIGSWTVQRGHLLFQLRPQAFEITKLSLENKTAELLGQAKASWKTRGTSGQNEWEWAGKGSLKSRSAPAPWDIPFEFTGKFFTGQDKREGNLVFQAPLWDGRLRAEYEQSGSAENPEDKVRARLRSARWRAFPFSADLEASWGRGGLNPLRISGRMASGGDFELIGHVTPDAEVRGTLQLKALNLAALAESLHFPKRLEGLADTTLTLSGPLSRLQWTGHLAAGPLTYAAGTTHPFKLDKLDMTMTLASLAENSNIWRLTLTEAEARTLEELVRFHKGSYVEFADSSPARLVLGLDLRNLHLGVFTLFGGLGMEGTWQIKPEGFAIQTKAQTRSLFINDYELEEGILQADYYNGELKFSAPANAGPLITGTINFQKSPQLRISDLFISGKYEQGLALTGEMGPHHWDFKMEGRGMDISTLGELSGFPYAISGAADLSVVGRGDSKHPHVEGSVDLDRGSILGLAFRSGTAVFVWQDDRITFSRLFLSDPGHYGLEGSGVFPLRQKAEFGNPENPAGTPSQVLRAAKSAAPSSPPIDFSIRLHDANLSLLKSFSREVREAKGPVEGLLQIKGTLDNPQLRGSLRVTHGDITGAHYFRRLRGGTLALDFDDNTLTIKDLRGKSGDGEFKGTGKITLSGFLPSAYDVQLAVVSSKGVEVQVPELAIPDSPLAKRFKFLTTDSRCDVQGHVALRGPAESPTFSGEGIFSNGHFTFPPSSKRPPPTAVLEWFRRIYWDVNLRFLDSAWFENELVQASVAGQLALKGPSDALEVNGGLDINQGRISYLGLQFDIRQARYDVRSEKSGARVINTPYIRGIAESQAQAVDTVSGGTGGSRLSTNDTITLNIDYAPVDQIKPRLTSAVNPTMTQDKLLARVTQTDTENLTVQERNYLYQKQLVSLIDSSLTTPLAQNVLKKAGIADRLHVQHIFDPNTAAGGDLNAAPSQQQSTALNLLANTKYTIEKDLSKKVSVGYGVRFIPSSQVDAELQQRKIDLISDVQLSYRAFKNLYLRGSFDLPNSAPGILPDRRVTIEPRWRFGWWGNTNKGKKK